MLVLLIAILISFFPLSLGGGTIPSGGECLGTIRPEFIYPPKMLDSCGQLLDPHIEKRG